MFGILSANKSLVMICLQNYQELLSFTQFLTEFIQTKRYPTSLDKMCQN